MSAIAQATLKAELAFISVNTPPIHWTSLYVNLDLVLLLKVLKEKKLDDPTEKIAEKLDKANLHESTE